MKKTAPKLNSADAYHKKVMLDVPELGDKLNEICRGYHSHVVLSAAHSIFMFHIFLNGISKEDFLEKASRAYDQCEEGYMKQIGKK